ncbi:DUF11 domain-containing protein [Comamonas sp. JUb58]|uniref:DUF11 domain-containing protein n=1 Tax=Comamonas sp. JUb58 TaxID=2485114 RepID=UPI00105C4144|nr:DUF11 domain-containing protein [Comamonas sp. JUb58]TDS83989.1 putative repeat protein (TIGR01451 family) [Comamonas sp. JUb58]
MFTRWIAAAAFLSACQWASAQPSPYIPTFSCQSSNAILNTGFDYEAGQPLPNGSPDTQWWVSSSQSDPTGALGPAADASWKPSSVPFSASLPAAWVSGASLGGQTNWISPLPNATTAPGPYPFRPRVTNYYRMQFNLPANVSPSALKLSMDYYSDDSMLGVTINGVFQALPPAGFAPGNQGTAELDGPWHGGLNTLTFSVSDVGWGSGMLAYIQPGDVLCETSLTIEQTIDQPTYAPAQTAHYTVTIRNPGPSDASLVTLSHDMPAALSNGTWSCTATNGAVCPADLANAPFSFGLPSGGALVFALSGTVAASGSLLSQASIDAGPGAICDASTGCTASADANVVVSPELDPKPVPVPGLGPWALVLLSLLSVALASIATTQYQRRR